MRFIKKLVIFTGGGARGTLMLEKNYFGVWCKLSIFDLPVRSARLAIISGDDVFVMKIGSNVDKGVKFELGELGMDEIHVAVVTDKVIMYGSNCATKLPAETVMKKVNGRIEFEKEQGSFITFSGSGKTIDDYFKQIAPPMYNDFAIAEKNYYPAFVTYGESDQADEEVQKADAPAEIQKGEKTEEAGGRVAISGDETEEVQGRVAINEENDENKITELMEEKKMSILTPHEMEQRYLRQMEAAATTKTEAAEQTVRTQAEEPQVVAVARRMTLRDFKADEKPMGRKATYFERSSAELEKLLKTNERFTPIEKLIPGSTFVKINYDRNRNYIVGAIGRDYICYGVPSFYSDTPPQPLCGYARWLPFDPAKPREEGFWMMYQDGISGETLKTK